MHKEILKAWDARNHKVLDWIKELDMDDIEYMSLFDNTIKILFDRYDDEIDTIDFARDEIVEIDHGSYQGDLIFIIHESGYQPDPSCYWWTSVSYGSCSGCDTLMGITNYESGKPNESQAKELWTLCLHMMQKMKKLEE